MSGRKIVNPIHIAAVGLATIRYFSPPSGREEFPWVSAQDTMRCFGVSRRLQQQTDPGVEIASTYVLTSEGRERLIRHGTASGIAQAMIELGYMTTNVEYAYLEGTRCATMKIIDHLSLEESFDYVRLAMLSDFEFDNILGEILDGM